MPAFDYGATPGPMVNYNANAGGYNPQASWSPNGGITAGNPGSLAAPSGTNQQVGFNFGSAFGGGGSQSSSGTNSASGNFDWGGLLGNLLGSIGSNAINIGGGIAGNNIATGAYDRSIAAGNQIKYSPSTVNGALGGVTPTRNADGSLSFNVSPNSQGQGLFSGANGMIGAGSQFLSNPGDPNAIAKQYYDNAQALAAPGEMTAAQSLFNQMQGNGRIALTQNGQLGDVGGLALAQQLAAQSRQNDALNFGNQLVNARAQTGGNLVSGGINSALGVNTGLMSGLPYSQQGGLGDLTAATNRATIDVGAANTLANNQANLLAGGMQGANSSGSALNGLLGQVGNKVGNYLGGKVTDWASGLFGSSAPAYTAADLAPVNGGTLTDAVAGQTPTLDFSGASGAGSGAGAAGGGASGAGGSGLLSGAGAAGASYGGAELAAQAASSLPGLSGSALAASQGMDPAIAAQINADMAAQGGGNAAAAANATSTGSGGLSAAAGGLLGAAAMYAFNQYGQGQMSKADQPWSNLTDAAKNGNVTYTDSKGVSHTFNPAQDMIDNYNAAYAKALGPGVNMWTGDSETQWQNWFKVQQWLGQHPNDPLASLVGPNATPASVGDAAKQRRNAQASRTIK